MKKVITILASLILTACVQLSTKNLSKNEDFKLSENEGIAVFGINGPESVRLHEGEILNQELHHKRGASLDGDHEDGYYVRAINTQQGNTLLYIDAIDNGLPVGEGYQHYLTFCGGNSKVITIEVVPGKAIYYGDLNFKYKAESGVISSSNNETLKKIISISVSYDFEKAEKYFSSTYKNINTPLEKGSFKEYRKPCPY